MDHRQTVVLVVTLWSCMVSGQSPADCNAGLFGSSCQYQCRCSDDSNCTRDGVCLNDVPCQKGWFGPACQYVDLAYNRSSARETTDGDDNTCLTTLRPVTVTLDNRYHVTWLRVRLSKPDFLFNLTVQFRRNASLSCTNTRTVRVDNTTLDIHCDLKDETVEFVKIIGKGVQHLCSVYISGGRNVALRQYSAHSSTHWIQLGDTEDTVRGYMSEKAVDGVTDRVFYRSHACSHTHTLETSNPHLNITFALPHHVTRYVLHNSEGYKHHILQGFELRSFGPSMTPVFNYTDRDGPPQNVYTVIPAQVTSPILLVKIAASENKGILILCEVEVYGDSACQIGMYGRECKEQCNCAGGQSCFVSTGGCPSGCAAGFMGLDCWTECAPGSYGRGCQYSCSQFCERDNDTGSHFCNSIDGTCLYGCQSGYQDSACNTNRHTSSPISNLGGPVVQGNGHLVGISVGCMFGVIIVAAIIGIIAYRRRKRTRPDNHDDAIMLPRDSISL